MTKDANSTPPETALARGETRVPSFAFVGGPLQRLGIWLGLVAEDGDALRFGLFLGCFSWLIFVVLATIQGHGAKLFSLALAAGHVRMLLVIPLLFLCESEVQRKAREFVEMIVDAGVVPPRALPDLDRDVASLRRWSESWFPDAAALLAAILVSYFTLHTHIAGKTSSPGPTGSFAAMPLAGAWYWLFCLPLFRFLIFRWFLRLASWWLFLLRLSRIDLHLIPTHRDGVGGLGYLEVVQRHFAPFVFSMSALAAAIFTEEISTGSSMFEVIYPEMAVAILFGVAVIVGPPCVFFVPLRECAERGLRDYLTFASRYAGDFEEKWMGPPRGEREPLLGTPDIQSLADLGNSIDVVRNMRFAPVSKNLALGAFVVATIPMLPVFLFKYPVAEIVGRLVAKLTGL